MARCVAVLLLVLVLAPAATAEPLRQAPSLGAWIGAVWEWLVAWVGASADPGEPLPPDEHGPMIIINGAQAPPPPPAEYGPMIIIDGAQAPPPPPDEYGPIIIVNG